MMFQKKNAKVINIWALVINNNIVNYWPTSHGSREIPAVTSPTDWYRAGVVNFSEHELYCSGLC